MIESGTLEWRSKSELPEVGRTVLACILAGTSLDFDLLQRRRVGDLCGKEHPNADAVVWYNRSYSRSYSTSYGAEGPSCMVCWAYVEAPTAWLEAVDSFFSERF